MNEYKNNPEDHPLIIKMRKCKDAAEKAARSRMQIMQRIAADIFTLMSCKPNIAHDKEAVKSFNNHIGAVNQNIEVLFERGKHAVINGENISLKRWAETLETDITSQYILPYITYFDKLWDNLKDTIREASLTMPIDAEEKAEMRVNEEEEKVL